MTEMTNAVMPEENPNEERYCDVCKKKFNNKYKLMKHTIIAHWEEKTKCLLCGELVVRKSLALHQRLHSGERPWPCDLCSESFISDSELQQHRYLHFANFQCFICPQVFEKKQDLMNHKEEMHSDLKLIHCEQCSMTFFKRIDLKRHYSLHNGVKPYLCQYCGKLFRTHSSMRKHEIYHRGLRPYHCEQCDKTFTMHNHLVNHRFVHSKEQPHECPTCHRKFSLKHNMKVHEKIHNEVVTKVYRKKLFGVMPLGLGKNKKKQKLPDHIITAM